MTTLLNDLTASHYASAPNYGIADVGAQLSSIDATLKRIERQAKQSPLAPVHPHVNMGLPKRK